jgi:hypothetical protein
MRIKMIDVMRRPGRAMIVAALAGLLGATAWLATSPPPAAAAHHPCGEGEFCLYFNEDANGGYYHFTGSDPNLDNDHYEGGDLGEIVGDTPRYVWNNGEPGPRDDVVVYGLPHYKGADACIRLDTRGVLPGVRPENWWNNIESYRWVANAECERAGVIGLGEIVTRRN